MATLVTVTRRLGPEWAGDPQRPHLGAIAEGRAVDPFAAAVEVLEVGALALRYGDLEGFDALALVTTDLFRAMAAR